MKAWSNIEAGDGPTKRAPLVHLDYNPDKDPFSPTYQNTNGHDQLLSEGQWLQENGNGFEVFPDMMCMSWCWPQWWNHPQVVVEQHVKGLPARLLHFPSGRQLWQITTPVHGFDLPGATLTDLNISNPIKEPEQ